MDSDSVDLGSNPGPPATTFLGNAGVPAIGKTGNGGIGQRNRTHKGRHNQNAKGTRKGPFVPPSFVYFMYAAGRIKIGFATDTRLRHSGLCGSKLCSGEVR